MKKKLSVIVGLAMVLGMGSTCFAEASSAAVPADTTAAVGTSDTTSTTLTLDQVLSSIEKNNMEINMYDQKILLYQRQFDRDHQNAMLNADKSPVNYPAGQYAAVKIAIDVVPKQDEQNIKDAKHDRDDTLQNLKFSAEQQYLNAINARDQITTINAQIANVDKKIAQTEAKIQQGQLTNDALQSLQVQRSQFEASLNTPRSQLQQSELNIKQIINMDLNTDVNLVLPASKQFVKFDDSSIQSKIDNAVNNSYDMAKITNNIAILKIQEDIYKQYSYNDATGEVNTGLSIQNLQNSLYSTQLNLKVNLWNSYYSLKNSEDLVNTENIKVENAQMNYDNTLTKVKEGVLTEVDLDSAALALQSEKVSLKSAQDNYMIALDQFQYNLSK
ncbi:TolC family protein [Clostridium sp. WLY-B-L2]|uniref:TolC family protein n=1 Tax=Clostridium aromativorans TaxID=2836848 RepID=A0ABS8N940_9CLOT|nr:TolC family protein [Clostridium aromativorans]MCC9296327.1 TolC family protein [Clostridium aromativorans]